MNPTSLTTCLPLYSVFLKPIQPSSKTVFLNSAYVGHCSLYRNVSIISFLKQKLMRHNQAQRLCGLAQTARHEITLGLSRSTVSHLRASFLPFTSSTSRLLPHKSKVFPLSPLCLYFYPLFCLHQSPPPPPPTSCPNLLSAHTQAEGLTEATGLACAASCLQ